MKKNTAKVVVKTKQKTVSAKKTRHASTPVAKKIAGKGIKKFSSALKALAKR